MCADEQRCSSLVLHDTECVHVHDSAAGRSAPVQKTLITSLLEIAFLGSLPVMPSKLRGVLSKLASVPPSSVREDFHGVTCGVKMNCSCQGTGFFQERTWKLQKSLYQEEYNISNFSLITNQHLWRNPVTGFGPG